MNLPNKLTVFRIVLTFVFLAFLFSKGLEAKVLALAIFLLASFTDLLDGFLAKKRNEITDFGRLMDPIADKILVLAALLAFVEMKIIPAWMVIIIIFREVAITGLRILALTKGKIIAADGGGKHKTVWQTFVIFAILLFLVFRDGGRAHFGFWNPRIEIIYLDAVFVFMLLIVVLTLTSGISYLVRNREVYSNAKKD